MTPPNDKPVTPLTPQQVKDFVDDSRRPWKPEPIYQTEFYNDIEDRDWAAIKVLADAILPGARGYYVRPEPPDADFADGEFSKLMSDQVELRRIPSASDVGVVEFLHLALREREYIAHRVPEFLRVARLMAFLSERDFDKPVAELDPHEAEVCTANIERDLPQEFKVVRQHCIEGYFSDPRHGGNRNHAGWKAIDLDSHIVDTADGARTAIRRTIFDIEPPDEEQPGD